jgi:hypothetical protein
VVWVVSAASKVVWSYVVATRVSVSIAGAGRVPVWGGSVEATDDGIVSVVPVPVTSATAVSRADTSKVVVRAVV